MSPKARHCPPHLFSLSNELLIEIISNLRPLDIHACQCTCRRLNNVIVNSQLIKYILHTALSGIFDPLEPGISLPERLDALERWETAWREMDLSNPIASTDAPVHADEPSVTYCGEQHFIMPRTGIGVPAGYSFLDLHSWPSSPSSVTPWTTINLQTPNVLSFAFAPELNLSVAFSAPVSSDHQNDMTMTIRPMSFNTGGPHPLASRLKFEVTVSRAAAHNLSEAMVIGDYILYWVGAPIFSDTHEGSTLCCIYLVAWKEGWVSELRTSLPGVYGPTLSVLSEEIILLIRLREPALELCRLANIWDNGNASLETICILYLPMFTSRARLQWVGCNEEHPGHALFSKNHQERLSPHSHPHLTASCGTGPSTGQPEGRVDARFRRPRAIPSNGIVNIMMRVTTLSGNFRLVDLNVRCRTLLEFTNTQTRVGATGVAGMGVRTVPMLSWEAWGPANSRILDHGTSTWGGLSGERHATAMASRITMRDYNPYRLRRALTLLGGARRKVTPACGSVVKVVNEASVYRGGEFFCNDIETSLPYVETTLSYDGSLEICMDGNYLVVEALTMAGEEKLHLHSL